MVMRAFILIILVGLCGQLLAEQQVSERKTIHPIIDYCKEYTLNALNEAKEKYDFEYEYTEFTAPLLSHPDVIGIVTLHSKRNYDFHLDSIMLKIRNGCYPLTYKSYDRKDPKIWVDIGEKIRMDEIIGVEHHHFIVGQDEITIFSDFNPRARRKNPGDQ